VPSLSASPKEKSGWIAPYLALGSVWGCSFIFIKLGLEFLTPFGVAFGHCLFPLLNPGNQKLRTAVSRLLEYVNELAHQILATRTY